MATSNAIYSTMVRAGRTTYFIDVKEAKNGSRYLSICESRIDGDQKQKTTIRIFGDSVEEFRRAVDEAATALGQ